MYNDFPLTLILLNTLSMDNYQLFCNQIKNDVQDINFIVQYARTPVTVTIGQTLEEIITIMSDPPVNVNTEIWISQVAKSEYYTMLCNFINFVDIPDELVTPDMFSIFTGFPKHIIKQSVKYIGRKSPKYIECWYNTFKEQIDSVIGMVSIEYILRVDSLKYLQQLFAERIGKGRRLYHYGSNVREDPDLRNYVYENCFELVDHDRCMANVTSYNVPDLFDFWKDKISSLPGKGQFWRIKNLNILADIVCNYPQYHKNVDWIHTTLPLRTIELSKMETMESTFRDKYKQLQINIRENWNPIDPNEIYKRDMALLDKFKQSWINMKKN